MVEIKDEFIFSIREELRQAVSDVVSDMRESARERLRSLEELMERLAVRLEYGLPMDPTSLPGQIKVATKYPTRSQRVLSARTTKSPRLLMICVSTCKREKSTEEVTCPTPRESPSHATPPKERVPNTAKMKDNSTICHDPVH